MFQRLSRNTLIKLASELVGRVASLALVLFAARRLGQGDFGFYSYGLALGYVLSQLADMGLQLLIAREVASSGLQARPIVQAALRLKLLLSLPVIALLLFFALSRDPSTQLSLLCLGLTMLLQTFLEFAAYVFRGGQRLREEARLLVAARLLTAALGGAMLSLGAGLSGLSLVGLIAMGLVTTWAFRRLRSEGWLILERKATAALPVRLLALQALPLGIAIFLSIAYTRLAIFLLETQSGEVAVAHFSAAQRLVEPTQILPAALLAALFPAFVDALRHSPTGAYRLGLNSGLFLGAVGAGLAAAFWLAAPIAVPWLYGEAFRDSIPVLQFLGLSIFPAYVNYGLTHYLIARGQQFLSSLFAALMLALHAVLSWQLIPQWGAVGPALSMTLAELLLLCCCLLALALTKPAPARALPTS
jgi:PST family polysaccharide transporter